MTEIDADAEQELLDNGNGFDQGSNDHAELNEDELLGIEEKIMTTTEEIKNEVSQDFINTARSSKDEDIDLFDEAIAPSYNNSGSEEPRPRKNSQPQPATSYSSVTPIISTTSSSSVASITGKYHCYIGNLTWWTTDSDLLVNIASLGIKDILEIKFFENRINGQSKGFALVAFGSEASLKTVMETLPSRTIHGSKPLPLPYNKQSQGKLEEASAKTQTRPDIKKKEENCLNMGTIRIGAGPPTIMRGGMQPMNNSPLMGRAPLPLMINGQPAQPPMQQTPLMGRSLAPPGVPMVQTTTMSAPQMAPVMSMQPNAARPLMGGPMQTMNPAPLMGSMGMRPGLPFAGPPQPLMGSLRSGMGMPPPGAHVNPNVFNMAPIPEAEFEEIMNRNRTVSSSAISRAMSDAHAGDIKAAIETLQTAMNLIKASRVAHDDRCRVLVTQLDDALRSIDSKGGYHSSSSRSRSYRDRRSRSRSRSRDRKRRRRSRSRTRSRSLSRSPRHRSSRHY